MGYNYIFELFFIGLVNFAPFSESERDSGNTYLLQVFITQIWPIKDNISQREIKR